MAVITISRELGSGGSQIAYKLAQTLNYNLVGKEIVHEIAKKMHKDEQEISFYDQESYSRLRVYFQETIANFAKSGRFFHPLGITPLEWDSYDPFLINQLTQYENEGEYFFILQQVIRELAEKDNIVIIGRGSYRILSNHPKSFHVRIVASEEFRINRIKQEKNISDEEAIKIIKQSDEASNSFINDFFELDWNDPHYYHLVLNSEKLGIDNCVKIIIDNLKVLNLI